MDRANPAARFRRTVSPPTRGWTRVHPTARRRVNGFPAHAGMDPRRPHRNDAPRGFPRPRGDGPRRIAAGDLYEKVSPPTRGWTASVRYDPRVGARRFPRPRGDGPSATPSTASIGWFRGFPAHAGMDPPTFSARRPPAQSVSPPTRGWTPSSGTFAEVGPSGFPAHAGMDRCDHLEDNH